MNSDSILTMAVIVYHTTAVDYGINKWAVN